MLQFGDAADPRAFTKGLRQANAAQLETWADVVLEASSLTGALGAPPNTH
jgi:hypothetical protein